MLKFHKIKKLTWFTFGWFRTHYDYLLRHLWTILVLLLFLIYSPCSCLSTDTWATKNLINNKLILTVYKLYLNLNPNFSEFTHREHLLGGTQGEEKQSKNLNSSISCCLHCRWVTLAPQLNTKIRIFRGWSGIQQVGEVWLFVVLQCVENNHSEITHSDFCCELQ